MRDRVDILHQPVVKLPTHGGRELADKAESGDAGEYCIVEHHQLEVTQPFDSSELPEQVEICYT